MGQQWIPRAKEVFPRAFLVTRAKFCQPWFRGTEEDQKYFSEDNTMYVSQSIAYSQRARLPQVLLEPCLVQFPALLGAVEGIRSTRARMGTT